MAYGARCFDFNDKNFNDADFTDSFHVNSTGAAKVVKRIVAALSCPKLLPPSD